MPEPPPATSLDKALQSLPHGPAFRFLDRITSLEPGVSVTASYSVRGDEAFLEGHFPGSLLLPGVILVEALAQAAGIAAQTGLTPPLQNLRLTAIRSAKILGSAVPGETLEIKAHITGRLGGLIQAEGEIHRTGTMERLLGAQIVLAGTEPATVDP